METDKLVVVTISGGVADIVHKDAGVRLIIYDFDNEKDLRKYVGDDDYRPQDWLSTEVVESDNSYYDQSLLNYLKSKGILPKRTIS
jgi:hypothetical protein